MVKILIFNRDEHLYSLKKEGDKSDMIFIILFFLTKVKV